MEIVLEFRSRSKTGKAQYKVQWKGWPTKYNQWLFTADMDEDLMQQFWLYGSKTGTYKRRKSHKSPHQRKSRQETLHMINKERTRALRGIADEEEPPQEQPVEGISSAFLQAFLGNKTEITELREDPNPDVQNFVRCFDPYEGYYNVPSRYYLHIPLMYHKFVIFHWINYL